MDDASTNEEVTDCISKYAQKHSNIKFKRRHSNGGISNATNDAIEMASGEFLVFVDHDDFLTDNALATIANYINENDSVDYLYSDEFYLEGEETIHDFRKPDWSPERFRSQMFTCHISVFRTSLVKDLGGLRSEFDGAQDYDLVLRVTEVARTIVHVPLPLYFWRVNPDSFSRSEGTQHKSFLAGQRAIQDHCQRVGINADVLFTNENGIYRVKRRISDNPRVSVVIPTNGSSGYPRGIYTSFIVNCIQSILSMSTYQNLEFVVVADSYTHSSVVERVKELAGSKLNLIWYERKFNFSDKINIGAVNSSGEYLFLLNDDTEVIATDWCETLMAIAAEEGIGAVGSQLLFEDDTLQHAGHLYVDGSPTHHGVGAPPDFPGFGGEFVCQREVSGVSAAAMMIKKSRFMEVGGMSNKLPNNYNDVDLCQKLRFLGYRNIYTPFAPMYHFESQTRDPEVSDDEIEFINQRWWLQLHDDIYARPAADKNALYDKRKQPARQIAN